MSHTSDVVFNNMRAVIEAPGFPLLVAYKNDFYKHDRHELRRTYSEEITYLWVVRDSGTHLYPLHIDKRVCQEADAALGMDGPRKLYLVTPTSVQEIDLAKARSLMSTFNYEVKNGFVMKNKSTNLASVWPTTEWVKGQLKGRVIYFSDSPKDHLTHLDRIALRRIAVHEVIHLTGSIFTPVIAVTFNGEDLMHEEELQDDECNA